MRYTQTLVSHLTRNQYDQHYQHSITNPDTFWRELAKEKLDWFTPFSQVRDWHQDTHTYTWFADGELNITHNCLDRHIAAGRGSQVAYHWEGEDGTSQDLTYQQLLDRVNQTAYALQELGIKKGVTVTIYLPLILEQIITMLACARIGAIHSVVYAGFSADALQTRIEAAQSQVVITANYTVRRGQKIDLLTTTRQAVARSQLNPTVLIVERGTELKLSPNERSFNQLTQVQSTELEPVSMQAEDPLFILYTSGTTGAPKGVVHTTGGYNLYTHLTTELTFNLQPGNTYWCAADCGWITGHSYIVYGPLSVGVTSIIAEGAPDYPKPNRWWSLIEKQKVEAFYTAPTAIRMFMKHGQKWVQQHDLTSLKVIGSVGEPINPEAWHWYRQHIGGNQATVVDTWWQTETGGHMLVTLPGLKQQPGKAGLPFYGVEAAVVDAEGKELPAGNKGYLVIKQPWPSALRDCWGNHDRYLQYWTDNPAGYFTGDFAIKTADGYFQVLGRADDVLSVAGHRIGTAELEDVLVTHPAVVEAAVVAVPDEVRGQAIHAFVLLADHTDTAEGTLETSIITHVADHYGKHAKPTQVHIVEKLPKTRSGKIMRRLLRAEITGEEVGDTSTVEG